MNTFRLRVKPDGTIKCVYNDKFPLAKLGKLAVTRASNVEFNRATQQWEVRLETNPSQVAYADPSRDKCIAWEIETITNSL